MSWKPIDKHRGLKGIDLKSMVKRIPSCLVNARTETSVLRLLSLSERCALFTSGWTDWTTEAFKHPDNQF